MYIYKYLILINNKVRIFDFFLELIQNVDDNFYFDSLGEDECFFVQFIMQFEGVVVFNNEIGFVDKNIRVFCDVGRSIKGKYKVGYIGILVFQFIYLKICIKRCFKNLMYLYYF